MNTRGCFFVRGTCLSRHLCTLLGCFVYVCLIIWLLRTHPFDPLIVQMDDMMEEVDRATRQFQGETTADSAQTDSRYVPYCSTLDNA